MTLEDLLAQTIADAFWETAEQPRKWVSMGENQRQVFRNCAVRAIAAARAFRETQTSRTPVGAKNIRDDQSQGYPSRTSEEGIP